MTHHRRPGQTTAEGYGAQHQALRRAWSPRVATGQVPCARCGEVIRPGTPWDLGHRDGTGKREYQGPEHRRCNRQAGAQLRNARVLDPEPQPMTRW
ncbi:hypothetical protein [Amycolatopsis sp. SID8362]|uniref:hypothetical protein n=1 Tax=Amycolatopsis sp. SID8362 TaxID=2690346 RepID=UPI00136A0D63|nr:hypothetical protein [Amycolatopsis sp. SID8362]NBH01949.1 hypothetical protein [Amycolatopsis sp. SID8362]NED38652.1 hypothetical protein [Amycolatopsis sp. SID8362]